MNAKDYVCIPCDRQLTPLASFYDDDDSEVTHFVCPVCHELFEIERE